MKIRRLAWALLGCGWAGAIACGGKVVVEEGANGSGGAATTTTTWTTSSTWTGTGTGTGTTSCDEPDCYMQCECLYPKGLYLYNDLVECALCGACHDVCEPEYGPYCGNSQELGCSAGFIDCGYGDCCGECINSECSLYQVCGDALQACDQEPDCWALVDCYYGC